MPHLSLLSWEHVFVFERDKACTSKAAFHWTKEKKIYFHVDEALARLGPHMSISQRSPRHYPQPRSFSTLAERRRARTRPSIEHYTPGSRACSRRAWARAAAAGSPSPPHTAGPPPPAASRRLGPPSRAPPGAARRRRGGRRTSGA